MEKKVIRQREMVSTKWSGGTTTQLYIEPQGLTVKDNFDFRISTATVERGESSFTFFKGYNRLLIILEGELDIKHEESEFKKLQPFEPHFFSGDVLTMSRSDRDIVDFNFIWKRELGKCEPVEINETEKRIIFRFNGKVFRYEFNPELGWELIF